MIIVVGAQAFGTSMIFTQSPLFRQQTPYSTFARLHHSRSRGPCSTRFYSTRYSGWFLFLKPASKMQHSGLEWYVRYTLVHEKGQCKFLYTSVNCLLCVNGVMLFFIFSFLVATYLGHRSKNCINKFHRTSREKSNSHPP